MSAARAASLQPLLENAVAHLHAGRIQEAERCAREVLAGAPNDPNVLNLLAALAHRAGRPAEAADLLRRAIAHSPPDANLHYNLGVAHHVQGELDEAIASYEQALRLRPDHADTCNNLGFALAERNRLEEALSYYARAVQLRPDYAEAHANAGLALAALGKVEEALERCEQALRIAPDNVDAHLARAALWLLQGDYPRGWAEYEWRWKPSTMASRGIGPGVPSMSPPPYTQPLWDGAPLAGRTILLHAEQGLGDALQFIRYAPLVKSRGGRVVVVCPSPLAPLLQRSPGIDVLSAFGSPLPPFDVWAPLLSLPRIFATTLANVPAEIPYVFPDPALVESWKRRLSEIECFKIGIVWECNRRYDWGRRRMAALRQFAPLAHIPGVHLISLQKGPGVEQVRKLAGEFPVTDFGSDVDEASFRDTAALIKNLHLVVAVDTSVAHLAGALGVPVWLALPFTSDWRWLLQRDDSPWYPNMRLFRQRRRGDWEEVFTRMADELASGACQRPGGCDRGVDTPRSPGDVHAPELHLRGVRAQQAGRNDEALALLRRAVALRPDNADYHYNLGVIEQLLGRKDEAQNSYRHTLRLNPDHAGALNNLGQLALNSDQLEQAENYLRHALRVQPDHGSALHNLGLVCKRRGKLEEAIVCFRQAVRLCPHDANIHYLLGQTLEESGQAVETIQAMQQTARRQNIRYWRRVPTDEARTAFREAVRLEPNNVLFRCALANLLTMRRQPGEALPHYEQALRLSPDDPAIHSNLGNILTQLGRPQEAEQRCREAMRLHPDGVAPIHNLANALAAQERLDEALESIETVLRSQPEHPGSRHCRAMWWLKQGRLAEGWREYEWRWKLPEMTGTQYREPRWDGSPLEGRTILLWAEQGLGDTLQAIRFAPLVKQRGGRVIVECQAPLVPLLSRCAGFDELVPRGSPAPPADVQAPLMSLPHLLGITLETLPAEVPYLFPDPVLVEHWRREVEGAPGLKIGITWQGNPDHLQDRYRSIPLSHFSPLARVPGVQLISLQKGPGQEQLHEIAGQFPVLDLGSRLDETTGAFMDTAAVLQNLDLVITSDTSVAHLAGGMGRPMWVALCIGCDWRWLRNRNDSPWYPSMRLFRQSRRGDWKGVFACMANELRCKVARG